MNNFTLQILNLTISGDVDKYKDALAPFKDDNPYYKIDFIDVFSSGLNDCFAFILLDKTNKPLVLMPFYYKPIEGHIESLEYYDVKSTYGYNGPLIKENTEIEIIKAFWNLVDNWYANNNVVSEFIRFSLNGNYLDYTGELKETLLNIKGKLSEETTILENYDRKVRKNIKKATREGISVKIYYNNITSEIFNTFYDIYLETMRRKQAQETFFFSQEKVLSFIDKYPDNNAIAVAYYNNIPVASELILCSNSEIFSFIGGTKSDYFKKRPNDLLKHEIILWANQQGFESFTLGGGYGSDDGIFKYKKSFFPNGVVKYFTGRKVINPEIYKSLVMIKMGIESPINYMTDFFPQYQSMLTDKLSEINEITSKSEWAKALAEVNNYDFYHTYDYHEISCSENESPIMLQYETKGITILLPLVLRSIPNTKYFDFTSVYGYAGPLSNTSELEIAERTKFQESLNEYLISKNIVSVFSRLHPYIEQNQILDGLGEVVELGAVVNIDVTLPLDESRRAYSKSNKNQINKLRRQCEVVKAETKEDIIDFISIYYENMKRLNADDHYYFDESYFLKFMEITDFETDILMVKDNETQKYIAGSMFIKTKDIVQFHLSGTRTDFLRLKPSKLFLDEMRIQAHNQGYKFFNLGGGLGSEKDTLFEFKASFSKDFRAFKIWKYVVNEDVYSDLSKDKSNTDYFPKYRA
ncbi:peptidoglycan bridge formation glycyltransferase FemA/FemB family protein [Winogradskyella sp.]|uniref:peptidoglycan bridge formation glycyltransferase FemA/FemB family protein n=1 Tax=Winogradskyella sp. TaxID=1883156 RepID=UPI003F6BB383